MKSNFRLAIFLAILVMQLRPIVFAQEFSTNASQSASTTAPRQTFGETVEIPLHTGAAPGSEQ